MFVSTRRSLCSLCSLMIACSLAPLAPCASLTRAAHALPPRSAPLPPPAVRRRRAVRCCASLSVLASDWAVAGDLSTTLFALGQQADALVHANLTEVTPVTYAVVLGAGLLTSLSPCTLSVLPLTIGYIGGTGSRDEAGAPRSRVVEAASFAAGLATTLALLGVAASLAGKAYGQVGEGLPIAVGLLAVLMGLNLLEVVTIPLPSFFTDVDVRSSNSLPQAAKAYLAGLTFALAASPCSTPVLATLLGYVASTGDPLRGGTLLLAYTSGYVTPLLVAASATGALTRVLALRQHSAWVTPASGALLVGGGVYSILSRIA